MWLEKRTSTVNQIHYVHLVLVWGQQHTILCITYTRSLHFHALFFSVRFIWECFIQRKLEVKWCIESISIQSEFPYTPGGIYLYIKWLKSKYQFNYNHYIYVTILFKLKAHIFIDCLTFHKPEKYRDLVITYKITQLHTQETKFVTLWKAQISYR